MATQQFNRKATLILSEGEKALDLSALHFRFKVEQQDVESPNNCSIRVFNLTEATVKLALQEFSQVVLQAGYEEAAGVIFQGTIKQFRVGRENATDTYLDILAADGDLAYNQSIVAKTLAANSTPDQRIKAVIESMSGQGVSAGAGMVYTGGVLPRGKVLFGMARALLRQEVQSQGATWSINNGKVDILPLAGYRPGEAVVLNSTTGLIGRPEQTVDGLRAQSLLNPRLLVGGLIQIDNKSINQTVQQNPNAAPIPFNQYTGLQNLATIATDGIYRLYVVEHVGDTRGTDWYSNLVGLAVNPVTNKVISNG